MLAYTSTILSEAGYRTGRYVSPTVMSYLEKIQVDGTWISELDFAQSVEKIKEAIASLKAKGEPLPTLFEAETAMAFLYFRKMHCDMVVLETGLGGETDATNIVKNTICAAFATISVDHLGVIGDTLEEIARTKSGIIKPGCAVVSARQTDVVRNVLKKKAEEKNCSYVEAEPKKMKILTDSYDGITFSYKEFEKMHSNLAGQCQQTFVAEGMEILLARPGVISDSWIMTGTCCPLPARTTGTETKPPLENITSGSRILISLRASPIPLITRNGSVKFWTLK